jgi:hypothetical protein
MKREAKVEKVARWKGEMVDAFDRRWRTGCQSFELHSMKKQACMFLICIQMISRQKGPSFTYIQTERDGIWDTQRKRERERERVCARVGEREREREGAQLRFAFDKRRWGKGNTGYFASLPVSRWSDSSGKKRLLYSVVCSRHALPANFVLKAETLPPSPWSIAVLKEEEEL